MFKCVQLLNVCIGAVSPKPFKVGSKFDDGFGYLFCKWMLLFLFLENLFGSMCQIFRLFLVYGHAWKNVGTRERKFVDVMISFMPSGHSWKEL